MAFDFGQAATYRAQMQGVEPPAPVGLEREDVPEALEPQARFLDAVEQVLLSAGLEYFGHTVHRARDEMVSRLLRVRGGDRVFTIDLGCNSAGRALIRMARSSARGVDPASQIRFPEDGPSPLVVGLCEDRYVDGDDFDLARLAASVNEHLLAKCNLRADAFACVPVRPGGSAGAEGWGKVSSSTLLAATLSTAAVAGVVIAVVLLHKRHP